MKKIGDSYEYLGELGSTSVEWKFDELVWDRFVDFCRGEAKITAPIGIIWFKSEKEEMKTLRYVYDSMDEEMGSLRSAGKLGVEVVEVFIEHECSEHIEGVIHLPSSQQEDIQRGDEEDDYSENEVEKPKEDDEPEESEDEKWPENNAAEDENQTDNRDVLDMDPTNNQAVTDESPKVNEDIGDEIVVDAAD